MQTDTWLNETSYPERCPLCSQPLNTDSKRCPSCGFVAHEPTRPSASSAQSQRIRQPNPVTPIPPRASAVRVQKQLPKVVSQNPLSPFPEGPSLEKAGGAGGWQHSSPTFEAASSLSSLSLIISETPTAPPRPPRKSVHSTENLPPIDEIDTQPPPLKQAQALPAQPKRSEEAAAPGSAFSSREEALRARRALVVSSSASPIPELHIDEIDTVPEGKKKTSRALVPTHQQPRHLAVDAASWTASSSTEHSEASRMLLALSRQGKGSYPRGFHTLDRLRWWLLRPGHIEFML
ncbi:MAG TPA: hypothetical protein VFN35_22260, partial [Ktedonobacteraceae bacterium]|nr:hypothetical protein [Ktedonobacteraceae bacterium]